MWKSFNAKKHLLSAAFSALVSFMLLILLKPFGISGLGAEITVYCLLLALFIGILISVFRSLALSEPLSIGAALSDIVYSLIMTGIVFTIVSLTERNIMLRSELEEERRLNALIQGRLQKLSRENNVYGEETVRVTGTTRKPVEFKLKDFLYATSGGNYVDIVCSVDGVIHKEDVRITMKELADQLASYPNLVRCHRAFIVNVDVVESARGNAQGYVLSLAGTTAAVPVSRSYVDIVREKISLICRIDI